MESAPNGHLSVKCLICGKPLPEGTLLPVCEEHVKTGEWGEYILDMVEERAASEARASSSIEDATLDWRVHHAEGDWQLLKVPRGRETQLTGEGPSEGLTTDWRAENTRTGEVRDFPQTAELDVWFDLLGIRPFDRALHEERMKEAALDLAQSRQRMRQMFRALRKPPGETASDLAREVFGDLFEADGIFKKVPQIQLAELLKDVHIPVYVPTGKPFGLEISSTRFYGTGRSGAIRPQTGSATFEFANRPIRNEDPARTEEHLIEVRGRLIDERAANGQSIKFELDAGQAEGQRKDPPPPPPVPTIALTIGSLYNLTYATPRALSAQSHSSEFHSEYAQRLFDNLASRPREQLSLLECEELCEQVDGFLWSYAPDLIDEIAASGSLAQVVRRQFVLEGTECQGTVLYWPGPEMEGRSYSLCSFRLEHLIEPPVVLCLVGGTFGISLEETMSLLEQLVAVNDRAELLAEYQTQLDEQLKRWSS